MTTLERRRKCRQNRLAEQHILAVGRSPDAKPSPSGAAGRRVDQHRLKPCRAKPFDSYGELKSESQNGNSGSVE